MPLHPLIVHAAVVFAPLASLAGLLYAVLPRWRWATRWPMIALAVIGAGSVLAAYLSGKNFLGDRPGLREVPEIWEDLQVHQDRALALLWISLIYVAIVLLAGWTLGGPSALASGAGAQETRAGALSWGAITLLVVGAVAVLVMTILTGDAGARAVWES